MDTSKLIDLKSQLEKFDGEFTLEDLLSFQELANSFVMEELDNFTSSEYDDLDSLPHDVDNELRDYFGLDECDDLYEYLDYWDKLSGFTYVNLDSYRVELSDEGDVKVYEVD